MSTDTRLTLCLDSIRRQLAHTPYEPLAGIGCAGARTRVKAPCEPHMQLVPDTMIADAGYKAARTRATEWKKLRCRHDFEYWCATCVRVKHKTRGAFEPFVLNAPQRRLAAVLEADRAAGRPMRVILLKARQWGGSTLVQMYMAWIQCCLTRNWHALICAHVKDTSASIRGAYRSMLAHYPKAMWDGDDGSTPQLKRYESSVNINEIDGRSCRVVLGSSENPDAIRGADYAMAHLSEAAFWRSGTTRSPDDFIRAVCGAVALIPLSLIAVESTANGTGNYFHTEWMRCKEGRGDKHAVFVPWYEIDINRYRPPEPEVFARSLDSYERSLWDMGLCLDQIYWHRLKVLENGSLQKMHVEYPTTDLEAFIATSSTVFSPECVERLRAGCTAPSERGELSDGVFRADSTGCLRIWQRPRRGVFYTVGVDIGGRAASSDWSVASVVAFECGRKPEVAAQWRGHIDHDLLARKIADIGRYYNMALLVVESNTLENEYARSGGEGLFILSRLADEYPNMYRRECFDSIGNAVSSRVGFHTNRSTKAMLIAAMIELVRDGGYTEHDSMACDELGVYEQQPGGAYGAKAGCHDDIVMSRALALHIGAASAPRAVGAPLPPASSW